MIFRDIEGELVCDKRDERTKNDGVDHELRLVSGYMPILEGWHGMRLRKASRDAEYRYTGILDDWD